MHPNSGRSTYSILVFVCFLILGGAATAVDVPKFHVHELVFAGPTLGPADKPIETVEFSTTWQHESGSPSYTIHGFWDGDGAGGGTGSVFKIRFTPTKVGVWELKSTQSNAPALDGQKEGTKITCVESEHHGFWEPDGIWFRRTDGVHQYVLGNVHYCLVIYDKRIDDVRGNAQYYKNIRYFLTLMSYNTDYSKGMNFLKPDGGESIEARYAGAPNPAFYAKADEIVKEAFKYDLICDMYAESQTRAIQNPAYLRYVAARFGSFANAWLQLDVEWNEYLTATQTKEIGTKLRSYLPYTTPLSVISTNNWNTGLNGPWCTHVCIQGKVEGLRNSYNAIIAQRKLGGGIPCNNDDNGVNGFQNDYKNITAEHEVERMLGCFLGAGYSGTGHEIGLSSPKVGYNGPFWTGGFDPTKHTCSYNLKYMREVIDTKTEFWKMVPEVKGVTLKDLDNPGTAVPTTAYALMGNEGAQYILGANKRFARLSAALPEGTWKVEQFDLMAMKSNMLSTQARDTFSFATPDSKASMTLFTKATSTDRGRTPGCGKAYACSLRLRPIIRYAWSGARFVIAHKRSYGDKGNFPACTKQWRGDRPRQDRPDGPIFLAHPLQEIPCMRVAAAAMATVSAVLAAYGSLESDCDTILARYTNIQLGQANLADDVDSIRLNLRDDGSWSDLTYNDSRVAAWDPGTHLSRALQLSRAWGHEKSDWYHSAELLSDILSTYDYYTTRSLTSANWWWNEIGAPIRTAGIMAIMRDRLTSDQIAAGLRVLDKCNLGQTGANYLWRAEVHSIEMAFRRDGAKLGSIRDGLAGEIKVSTAEGVQPDYSFHQHGAQIQNGHYGLSYLTSSTRLIKLFNGLQWQLPKAASDIMVGLLLDGNQWFTWNGVFAYPTLGRAISRPSGSGYGGLVTALEDMESVAGNRAAEMNAYAARVRSRSGDRGSWLGNKDFWRSATIANRSREGFQTVRAEDKFTCFVSADVNDENLKGIHLSHGSHFIMRDGDEYSQIFPAWNWKRVSGTTVLDELPGDGKLPDGGWNEKGESPAAGGCSNGTTGMYIYDMHCEKKSRISPILAHKSWVFIDNLTVCIGTAISSSNTIRRAITTMNQTFVSGDATAWSPENSQEIALGASGHLAPSTVFLNDSVGYAVLTPDSINYSVKEQGGSWQSINLAYAEEVAPRPVMTFWLDHGVGPAQAQYAYAVYSGVSRADQIQLLVSRVVKIVHMSDSIHVVRDINAHALYAAFFRAGSVTLDNGETLSLSVPGLCILRDLPNGSLEVSVSDPYRASSSITVATSIDISGPGVVEGTGAQAHKLSLMLGSGGSAGKTVTTTVTGTVGPGTSVLPGAGQTAPVHITPDATVYTMSGRRTAAVPSGQRTAVVRAAGVVLVKTAQGLRKVLPVRTGPGLCNTCKIK